MSKTISQPVGQKRLTNVAVVKLQKNGHRFEIACYRNKVVNWRNRIETDLGEVLHRPVVFRDVGKGILAGAADLEEAFGTTVQEDICREILDRGELQIGDKERQAELSSLYRDIATIVSEKTVNPETNRPYTVSMITNAMNEIHFAVKPAKTAKQQALEVIKLLADVMPIERAKMHLRITFPRTAEADTLVEQEFQRCGAIQLPAQSQDTATRVIDILLHPAEYKAVETFVRTSLEGGRLDLINLSVQEAGVADVDVELARRDIRVAERGLKEDDTKAATEASLAEPSVDDEPAAAQSSAKGGKKSKLAKRLEKEAKKERELQAEQEQQRRARRAQQQELAQENEEASKATSTTTTTAASSQSKAFTCTTCGGEFADATAHRAHFRSDWHRINLRQKLKNMPRLTEEEFNQLSLEDLARLESDN